jgi:hypothetical protein
MDHALNSQICCHINKHGPIIDIKHLFRRNLGYVQSNPENIRIGLTVVDEAGGNEKIDASAEFVCPDPVLVQFAPLVADGRYL